MSDLNKLFDQFPDYDVFTGKTTAPKKRKKPQNTARRKSAPKPVQRKAAPPKPSPPKPSPQEPVRSNADYGDNYGKAVKPVKVKSETGSNALTLFYFPVLIIWLEFILRLVCREELNPESLLYLAGFSLPIAFALTLICTLGGNVFNRVLCNIFTLALTGFFFFEIVYFSVYKGFFSFSNTNTISAEQFTEAVSDKKFYLIALIIPLLVNLFFGHKIFGFRKFRIPAKITLLIIAVLIQIIAIYAVNTSQNASSPVTSYTIYHSEAPDISVQERFGLLTMERLSAFPSK